MTISPGQPWGTPEASPPDLVVRGVDSDLAEALVGTPARVLVSFTPSVDSDLARAVGIRAGAPQQGLALPMDVIELDDGSFAVNAVVVGCPPDRLTARRASHAIAVTVDGRDLAIAAATTVVVASGQWLRGRDLVPRGHPGDGKAEVQVYSLRRTERRAMRSRLATGTHLPHSRIVSRTAVAIEVRSRRPLPLEVDGRALPPTTALRVTLFSSRYRLLI